MGWVQLSLRDLQHPPGRASQYGPEYSFRGSEYAVTINAVTNSTNAMDIINGPPAAPIMPDVC